MNDTYQNVPTNSVYESRTNPRRHFNEEKLAELTASVKEVGILEPLLVRKNPDGKGILVGCEYELIAGARRYRAGKRAGLQELPVRICEMTDQQVLEVQLIENLLREDVDEVDEGLGFRALMNLRDANGKPVHTVDSIAERISKNRSYIYTRLKLADGLEAPVEKAFHAGKITAGHAILLARLQPADQAQMFKETIDRDYSVRQLESQIQRTVHLDLHAAAFPKDDAKLVPAAGSCVECPKRTGFQPDLFPDIAKKDTCTDRRCYAAKTEAFIQVRQKEIEAQTKIRPLLLSSLHYTSDKLPKGTHLHTEYTETAGKKNCTSTKIGLLVDGQNQGQTISVCLDKKCKVHHDRHGYSRSEPTQAEKDKRAKELADQRLQAEIRSRTLTEVLAKVRWPLSKTELQAIAKAYLTEMHGSALQSICEHFKLEPGKEKWGGRDYKTPLGKYIDAAPDRDLAAFLVLLALDSSNAQYYYNAPPDERTELKAAAARYKVDMGAITRTVTYEMAAKKKPAVQTPAKGKAKAAGR
jgi:ParB family chromosome partitioning protein